MIPSARFQSQIGQDQFVAETLGYRRGGTFIDVGCGHYQRINNTYYLEKELGWSGIGVDSNHHFATGWHAYRTARFVCGDATKLDWPAVLVGTPEVIDYLSIDLEPPQLALGVLEQLIPLRSFWVVTFEHDSYRQTETVGPSRELMLNAGYTLAVEGVQDDFWVINA